ncbi:hypothetical protein SAMN05216554_1092 [Herbiconiux ginsengi]|uniref:Uncharacterized protein n=1 Tax=Herbiconiux ginsengi TaxID=381665 RepID=A0A1H3LRT2_9MICO|nr:hypothetical protein SAMN05216554_1092 [Herbiconiux ginsengi]
MHPAFRSPPLRPRPTVDRCSPAELGVARRSIAPRWRTRFTAAGPATTGPVLRVPSCTQLRAHRLVLVDGPCRGSGRGGCTRCGTRRREDRGQCFLRAGRVLEQPGLSLPLDDAPGQFCELPCEHHGRHALVRLAGADHEQHAGLGRDQPGILRGRDILRRGAAAGRAAELPGDVAQRPRSIALDPSADGGNTVLAQPVYDAAGRLLSVDYSNGSSLESVAYNAAGRTSGYQ